MASSTSSRERSSSTTSTRPRGLAADASAPEDGISLFSLNGQADRDTRRDERAEVERPAGREKQVVLRERHDPKPELGHGSARRPVDDDAILDRPRPRESERGQTRADAREGRLDQPERAVRLDAQR